MTKRRRFPDSLRWRSVEWMEMGLPQDDTAILLNVYRSVTQRFWDQVQISVPNKHGHRQHRVITPAGVCFLAFSA